jgi:hypothetical protein
MSHQLAQKRAMMILPLNSSEWTVLPLAVGRLKAGIFVALFGTDKPSGSGGKPAAKVTDTVSTIANNELIKSRHWNDFIVSPS